MVEPSDHGNSPRVVLAARTFSTPIAIAAVRCGNLVDPRTRHHVVEGAIEDLVLAPRHFLLFPEQLLQVLHPFEIADHDAAGIAEDVGYQEDLVLALFQHQIGVGRGRPVGAFRQHAAFEVLRDIARRSRAPSPPAPARRRAASGFARDRIAVRWKIRRCCHARRRAASRRGYRVRPRRRAHRCDRRPRSP